MLASQFSLCLIINTHVFSTNDLVARQELLRHGTGRSGRRGKHDYLFHSLSSFCITRLLLFIDSSV